MDSDADGSLSPASRAASNGPPSIRSDQMSRLLSGRLKRKKVLVSRKRLRGVHISTRESPMEAQQEGLGEDEEPLEGQQEGLGEDEEPLEGQQEGLGEDDNEPTKPEQDVEPQCSIKVPAEDDGLLMSVMDVIGMRNKRPDKRFADTHIFDILKMKGIGFPSPWWILPSDNGGSSSGNGGH